MNIDKERTLFYLPGDPGLRVALGFACKKSFASPYSFRARDSSYILAAMRKQALLLHRLTLFAMVAVGIWGLVMALAPVHPFWIDEWRLIYNLKFKTTAELWGPLKFTQQFPRLYLVSLKAFTQAFNYSYTSLRLPALVFALATMLLSWRLIPQLFPEREGVLRLLFTLIIISSETFTYYLVQTKHYEAEIFLAVLALWQGLQLLMVSERGIQSQWPYVLLCISMSVAPPFSYTYPIAITPVFLIAGVHSFHLMKAGSWRRFFAILFPLGLSICGILFFYFTDVRQLMQDQAMHHYWENRMAAGGSGWEAAQSLWQFFASAGAGFVFEIIFSILGMVALVYGLLRLGHRTTAPWQTHEWMYAYAAIMIVLVVGLFFAGKLPLGEGKFAAFCVPALSLLIVAFLQSARKRFPVAVSIIGLILFAGLLGNIPVVICRSFGEPEYARRMAIYRATQSGIKKAAQVNMPIFVTPNVAWPDEIVHKVPYLENITANAVLKTFPAYDVTRALTVYTIADRADARRQLATLPESIRQAVVLDAEHYWLITR